MGSEVEQKSGTTSSDQPTEPESAPLVAPGGNKQEVTVPSSEGASGEDTNNGPIVTVEV